jgi:hypothetical protein
MTDTSQVGIDAQQFRAIALEARRLGTQNAFIDFAMLWASDCDAYINHLVNLLEQHGVLCICTGLRLDPMCPVHAAPPPKDLLQ